MIPSSNVRAAFCIACRKATRHEKRGNLFGCECGKERGVTAESSLRLPLPFKPTKSLEGRFHDSIRQTPYCWIWEGSYHLNGKKPQIKMRTTKGQYQVNATYLSWYYATGCWPRAGLWIIRICANVKCVNPDHLVEGTRKDWGKIRSQRMLMVPAPLKTHCKRGHRFPENRMKNGDKFTCYLCRLITNRRHDAAEKVRQAAKRLEAKGWTTNHLDFQAPKAQEIATRRPVLRRGSTDEGRERSGPPPLAALASAAI